MTPTAIDALLRPLVPQVLGALVRRHGQFDACEDAVQEALLAAATQWPVEGVPANPRGWLVTVAGRRLTDLWRSESARRRREETLSAMEPEAAEGADAERPADRDDTLTLLFLCCHPALSPPSQVALTLRAVGGLTTVAIAKAFLVPEATMAQRISRAKRTVADTPFTLPADRAARLGAVLHVLYLVFNEGYTTTDGPDLQRADLTAEAIRLTREVHTLLPEDGEVAGLLALMLLTDARRDTRTTADGALVPLAEQDRDRWDAPLIIEGVELITATLARSPIGPYQLQAAIAAVHAEAPSQQATDWPQIAELYRVLDVVAPSPVVTLNRAVAVGMAEGPQAGLALLAEVDDALTGHHRVPAVRAHLLELAGDTAAAVAAYEEAARLTTSLPERRYLAERAARVGSGAEPIT